MEEKVKVELNPGATPGEIEGVAEVLREAGIPADVRERRPPAGVGNGADWEVVVLLSVAIATFLKGYLGAAGEDAWKGTKRVVGRLKRAREPWPFPDGYLVLRQDETNSMVLIPSTLSDDGFRKLHELTFEPDLDYWWEEDQSQWVGRSRPAQLPSFGNRVRRLFRR